jgi:hypothetical protein
MNRLLGHCLILLGAGAAACAASFAIEHPDYAGAAGDTAIVVAHQSHAASAAVGEGESLPAPQSREALVRLLEHELVRVGCYSGAIGSTWGSEPQAAMRAFLARVNARLPVTQPDEILLRLVQGEKQRVCGEPCRAQPAPAANANAACFAGVLTADAAPLAAMPERSTGQPAAAAPQAPPVEQPTPPPGPAPADTRQDAAQPPAPSPSGARREADAELAPEAPTHHAASRHALKSFSGKRPPKLVRLLLRNLQRFAQFP